MEKGREANNTWVSRVWEALKRDLSAGFAKNPLVVGWNLLMCVRKHLHHPGGGRVAATCGSRTWNALFLPHPTAWNLPADSHALPVLSALTVHRCSLSGGSLGAGDVPPAARVTFWLGKELFLALGQKKESAGSSPSSQGRVPVYSFASLQPHPGEFGCSEAALKDRPHRGCEGVELGRVNQLPVA